jgi:hypothetical protein
LEIEPEIVAQLPGTFFLQICMRDYTLQPRFFVELQPRLFVEVYHIIPDYTLHDYIFNLNFTYIVGALYVSVKSGKMIPELKHGIESLMTELKQVLGI